MKRVLFGIGLVIVALCAWLWRSPPQSSSDDAATIGQMEVRLPEQLLPMPETAVNQTEIVPATESVGAQVASREAEVDSRSCDEAKSRGIVFATTDLDEAACAQAVKMAFGPRVPVLPGIAGFDIPDRGASGPRERLFAETDNPPWSRAMEVQLYDVSARIIDFPLMTLYAVCRSETCGVLFAYTNTQARGDRYNYYAQGFADQLGFRGFYGGHARGRDGAGFMYVYLGDWSRPRLE